MFICREIIIQGKQRWMGLSDCRDDAREPRGIGFVEYTSPRDAEDARYGLDGTRILDREVNTPAKALFV